MTLVICVIHEHINTFLLKKTKERKAHLRMNPKKEQTQEAVYTTRDDNFEDKG